MQIYASILFKCHNQTFITGKEKASNKLEAFFMSGYFVLEVTN